MVQNKSLRHFERYTANITIHLKYCGSEIVYYTSTDFICAFCMRQLVACVRPFNNFPRKYCNIDIEFKYDNRPLPPVLDSLNVLHNYVAIEQQIMRAVLFVLSSQLYIYEKGF